MFINYLQMLLLLSIPQAFVHFKLAISLWNLQSYVNLRRILLFALVSSAVIDIDFFNVPILVHSLFSVATTFFLIFLLLRKGKLPRVLIVALTYYAFVMIDEFIGVLILKLAYGLEPSREAMIAHFPAMISSQYPVYLLVYVLSLLFDRRELPFRQRLFEKLVQLKQNRVKEILPLALLQTLLLFILYVISLDQTRFYTEIVFRITLYILLIATIFAFFYTVRLLTYTRQEAVEQTQEAYVGDIIRMFTAIRGQRHDFLNHVQVMSSMLQMNKLEQLKRYMGEIVSEAHAVGHVVHHESPALAAFIQLKRDTARQRGIRFEYSLPFLPELEHTVQAIDLVKILGNLVDNAFEESDTLPTDQRLVKAELRLDGGMLILEVSNRGRLLSELDRERMVMPGYTTKKGEHSGLGLAIVSERAQHYNGKLSIESSAERGTVIAITLPVAPPAPASVGFR